MATKTPGAFLDCRRQVPQGRAPGMGRAQKRRERFWTAEGRPEGQWAGIAHCNATSAVAGMGEQYPRVADKAKRPTRLGRPFA